MELFGFDMQINAVNDIVVLGHDVLQSERIAVFIGVDGVAYVYVLSGFFLVAEMHQDFVFNASGSIGGKAGPFFGFEG